MSSTPQTQIVNNYFSNQSTVKDLGARNFMGRDSSRFGLSPRTSGSVFTNTPFSADMIADNVVAILRSGSWTAIITSDMIAENNKNENEALERRMRNSGTGNYSESPRASWWFAGNDS